MPDVGRNVGTSKYCWWKYKHREFHISSHKSSKSGMDETRALIYPETKFLSICGSVKLQNRLSVSRIQWWNSYKIDIHIPKAGRRGGGGGVKGIKGPLIPRKSESK